MTKGVMLDTGPLGQIAHHRPPPGISAWVQMLLRANVPVYLSEVADYEVRRSLLLSKLTASLAVLDDLPRRFTFRPITTQVMRSAAQLWADARRRGRPTADPKELDVDVILAAQAIEADAIVATDNIGHIGQFCSATSWQNIQPRP